MEVLLICFCFFAQGNIPTREAIRIYYQEQMMRSSRESDLDRQTSSERGREDKDALSSEAEEQAGSQTAEEKPEPKAQLDKCEEIPELVSGTDGPEDPGSKENSAEETVGVLSATEGDPTMDSQCEDGPECSVAKTSQRWRPKLSRMDRVTSSSSSSSSEEEMITQTDRWVLLNSNQFCLYTFSSAPEST